MLLSWFGLSEFTSFLVGYGEELLYVLPRLALEGLPRRRTGRNWGFWVIGHSVLEHFKGSHSKIAAF